MSDEDKNAARTAIQTLESKKAGLSTSDDVHKLGYLAIAKTLWLIAMILVRINEKLKK